MGYGNKVNVKGKEQPVIIKSGIVSTDYENTFRNYER
jgi:hypothetical protein